MKNFQTPLMGMAAFCCFLGLIPILNSSVKAQVPFCANHEMASKYWQYRASFSKHFIAIDRDSLGCINDGIGQDSANPCICSKAGLSLPATSINMGGNGAIDGGFSDRSTDYGEYIANPQNYPFYDPDCGRLYTDTAVNRDPVDWNSDSKKTT